MTERERVELERERLRADRERQVELARIERDLEARSERKEPRR